MAAFNFPNSPSDGDTHTENGLTYVWDGTNGAWKRSPASLSKGVKGDKGNAGTDGDKGSKGDNKGEQGDKGEPGDVTAKGAKGEPGDKGDEGDKGNKGDVEAQGNKGDEGQKGEPGDKGDEGVKGEIGSTGAGMAVGGIVAWSGSASSLPSGYFLCDGSAISRSTYAPLYDIVGTTHGSGDGSSTFNLPDLRDRFIVGASNSTGDTSYPGLSPGATGGTADASLVAHSHTITDPGHFHTTLNYVARSNYAEPRNFGVGTDGNLNSTGDTNSKTTGITVDSNGGSATGKNLPPFYSLAYIIQYAQGGDVAKGQKGEAGSDGTDGDKGQKGEAGADNSTKGQKGEAGSGGGDSVWETTSAGINTSSNVGIGTNLSGSGSHLLHLLQGTGCGTIGAGVGELVVESNNAATIQLLSPSGNINPQTIYFGDESSVSSGRIQYSHSSDSMIFKTNGNNERLRIGSSGISTIYGKGVITDTGGDVLTLESTVNTSRTTIKFNTDGNDWELGSRGSVGDPMNTFYIFDHTASEYRMVIDSSGDIGIGTTNPFGMLEVQKNGVPAIISNYNNSKHVQMDVGNDGGGLQVTTGNHFAINHQPYADRGTNNNLTERFRITSGGMLIKGHTGSAGQIETQFNQQNQFHGNDRKGGIRITDFSDSAFSANLEFVKSRAGTVGVNTTLQDGDRIGSIYWGGANGTNFQPGAFLTVKTDGTVSSTSMPTAIIFGTNSGNNLTERFRIGSSGQFGLSGANYGTSGQVLTSNGSSSAPSWQTVSSSGSTSDKISEGNTKAEVVDTGSNGHFLVETEGTERLRITSTGQLDLAGDMQFTVANPELEFNNGGPRFRVPAANTLAIHNGGGLGSTNNEVVRITSNGSVGIGTDDITSGAKLEVVSAQLGGTAGNTQEVVRLHSPDVSNNTSYRFTNYRRTNGTSNTSSEMRFRRRVDVTDMGYFGLGDQYASIGYGTTEKFRIASDGKVGIGTTNPQKTLHVSTSDNSVARFETTAVTGRLDFKASGSSGIPMLEWKDNDFNIKTTGHLSDPVISIKSDGRVGIGTTNPDAAVTSSNTAKLAVGIVTAFKYYGDGSNLTGISGGATGVSRVAVLKDQKDNQRDGGTFTASGWRDRDLTVEEDPSNFVDFTAGGSQSSGSGGNTPGYWSLPAGTYKIDWAAVAHNVNRHKTRLVYSTTQSHISTAGLNASASIVEGNNANVLTSGTYPLSTNSIGSKVITLTETTWFKVMHYCSSTMTGSGFGKRQSTQTGNESVTGSNIYAQVIIEDLATAIKEQDLGTTKVAVLRDEKTSGTEGGQYTAGVWHTRTLNVEYDPSSFVSLSSNVFSMAAGDYKISWRAPGFHCDGFQTRIAYTTDSTFSSGINYYYGSSQYSGETGSGGGNYSDSVDESEGEYVSSTAATTYYRIEQKIGTSEGSTDFGLAATMGLEVYLQVSIEDLATALKSGVTIGDKIEEGNTSAEVIDTGTNGKFVVKTEGVERVIVDPSGYLNTRADIRLRRTSTDDGALYFGDTNDNYIFGSDTDDVLTFAIAGNEKLRLKTTSNTYANCDDIVLNNAGGVATTNNVTGVINMGSSYYHDGTGTDQGNGSGHWSVIKLHLWKDNDATTNSQTINNIYGLGVSHGMMEIQTDGVLGFFVGNDGTESGSRLERMRIHTSGLVSIGGGQLGNESGLGVRSAGNTCVLKAEGNRQHNPLICWNNHNAGAGAIQQIQFGDGTTYASRGSITTNGSNVTYGGTSDYRLKQDEVLITDGIEKVKLLKPRRFKWKNNLNLGICDGFFAHEIEESNPTSQATIGTKDAVATESDVNVGLATSIGDPIYQQVDQTKLIPVLTAALKEAIAKIETLEAKVAALEG
jgi:microcystin-dependent protein/predicted aspartyl protease